MQYNKFIDILLKYNDYELSDKEFIDFLNSDKELQNIFNKSLKSYLMTKDVSVVLRLNEEFSKIGTQEEKFTIDNKSANSFTIHFFVKQLLAKKYFNCINEQEAKKYILDEITNMSLIYDASKEVEAFIKSKILNSMPRFEKASDAIKYVKAKVKELFKYENKAPYFVQGCEWPFDNDGNPMKFISQKRTKEKVEYIFKDVTKNAYKTIVQYY